MTKRNFDEFKILIESVDNVEFCDQILSLVKEKQEQILAKKKVDDRNTFLNEHGYFISVEEIDELKKNSQIIVEEIYVDVRITSWGKEDHSDAEISQVTCDDPLYNVFELDEMNLVKVLDVDELNWHLNVKFKRDDWDSPYYATLEHVLYVYVKKQPVPVETDNIKLCSLSRTKLIECKIENNQILEIESDKLIITLEEWSNSNYYNLKKLKIANPF